jgi:Fibronectin type III domain
MHLLYEVQRTAPQPQASKARDREFPGPRSEKNRIIKEALVMAFRKPLTLALALPVLAAIFIGCAEDTTAPTTQNTAPMLAPTNVQAAVINGGDIEVSWSPSSQPDVAGYNVYRLDVANSRIGRLNVSRIAASSYIDGNAVRSHEYEYRVTAVNAKGVESHYSAVTITNQSPLGDHGKTPGLTQ